MKNKYAVIVVDMLNDFVTGSIAHPRIKHIIKPIKELCDRARAAGVPVVYANDSHTPDIDKEFEEDAVWSWWMPWYQTWDGKFVDKTSKEEWTKCMSDNRVITLEDHSAGWEVNTGITSQKTESLGQGTIYTLQGMKKGTRQDLDALPHGIYIVDGKKVVKK